MGQPLLFRLIQRLAQARRRRSEHRDGFA